jgi:4-hydroxy-tetrahydrodipicolinate reductase
MKIALIGYGKMGKEIEQLALAAGHDVILKVDKNDNVSLPELSKADAAIEFSEPTAAFNNIMACFNANVPVVVGTTGWHDRLDEVTTICKEKKQALFYSSNFSVGVNIFFEINKKLASLMNERNEYNVEMEEVHHNEKKDAPSGTAITLANGILEQVKRKKKWKNILTDVTTPIEKDELLIRSYREGIVPGTHRVKYLSEVDEILIEHKAFSRKGFASGALLAAEWIKGKKGVFTMSDLLKL